MPQWLTKTLASGFYSGYSPLVPGTTGTVPAWILAWLLAGNSTAIILLAVIFTAASVWLASQAEKIYGHDAKKIVIDEWAGMFITVIALPFSLVNYGVAFFFFRLFDVIKIPPARQAERLPSGWGVTMDDVVAGLQANIVSQLVVRLVLPELNLSF